MKLGSFNQVRQVAYRTARVAGDAQAIRRGRIPQRAVNRALGRTIKRAVRGWWR